MTGGARLAGEVEVVGAKNSVLKLMAAALLAPGETTARATCRRSPTSTIMRQLLERLGCAVRESQVRRARTGCAIEVPAEPLSEAPYELVRRIRGSICVLGPLLARTGRAKVALPGGDAIGSRPLDMHFAGLERMGAEIRIEHGYIVAEARELRGATIWLDFPSVGATENIMTAAVLAKGTTVIDNAAREPEIVDLCRMLVAMGAQIDGIGSSTLEITGVEGLRPDHATTPSPTGSSPARGRWPRSRPAATSPCAARTPPTSRSRWTRLVRAGADVEVRADGFRVAIDRPAAQLRRRHAALPGPGHRPAAAGDRAARRSPTAPR